LYLREDLNLHELLFTHFQFLIGFLIIHHILINYLTIIHFPYIFIES
jgi:hypothetical protein